MVTSATDISYKTQLEKALATNEAQQLTIQALQLEILQLKKLVFGSRHEKFMGAVSANAPELFNVPALAEVVTTGISTVSYEKTIQKLQPNHKGRNSFPQALRREEQVLYPEGTDLATAKKIGEDVTETLAYKPCELFVKKVIRPKLLDAATNRILQAAAPDRCFEKAMQMPVWWHR